MPFILANEICDRFAATGFHANMTTYLTRQLNLPLVKASNTLTNFSGTASFTPLIGALIADSYAGRFWTIIIGSIIYELGMIGITVSAILPSLRPPPCPAQLNCKEAATSQLWVLYISLLLTSLGTGGIRPCVVTFAADQIDMTKSSVASRGWNFFNWYYFSMGMATLTALTVVVYVQDDVGWGWGLGIPTIAMALSIAAFVFGSPLYVKLKPGGSPLVRLAQVIVAAVKKRKLAVPRDPAFLYQNKELDAAISVNGRLLHTNQFKPCFIRTTLRPLGSSLHWKPSGITCLQRMGIGFFINIIATVVSALVEMKRKAVAAHHNSLDDPKAIIPISVFWLVPQFCLHGVAEVFMSVGHLEFLYDQSPESMRSTAAALYWLAISMGNYIGTLMVSLVHKYTGQENNWLPDRNLNRGRLDYYYWLVTGIQVLNLVYYVICAWVYTYKPLEEANEEDGEAANDEIEIPCKRLNDGHGDGEVELTMSTNEMVRIV
ncbi:hypothetical protein GH714_039432 [Hevea brasiliensis]|uniref:Major facilitator superfamily (MFS) profile domain-containing protein n=1 Tax=Hevea brasiliensis TaxID=3981 RepID=A0A6A6M7M7_HEVBR|nr:hypothetical protein GH714_039432 [Hevea brasiliensis]